MRGTAKALLMQALLRRSVAPGDGLTVARHGPTLRQTRSIGLQQISGTLTATPLAERASPMIDPFGRTVTYLRVSVTDRCDFRCTYCMAEDMTFLPKKDLLTLEELDRLCSAFITKGVRKLRLTGGEPLVRKNIMHLIRNLSRHLGSGLDELTLTTNGSQLSRFADELADAGVRRINVSLDNTRRRQIQGHHPLGRLRPRDGGHSRCAEGRHRDQAQRRRPQGFQRA